MFKAINQQLELHRIIVKTGAIVNASVIYTALKPKGTTNYKVTENRKLEPEVEISKEFANSVDQEASWLKKVGKYRFGYKKQQVTDNKALLGIITTKVSTNEIANFEAVLNAAYLPLRYSLKKQIKTINPKRIETY